MLKEKNHIIMSIDAKKKSDKIQYTYMKLKNKGTFSQHEHSAKPKS